jgi:hypothetical protein
MAGNVLDEVSDRELARDDIRIGVHLFQSPLDQRLTSSWG